MKEWLAAALLLAPHVAWAHGDHAGPQGIQHVLTSPEHLAALLLVGSAAAILRQTWKRKRRRGTGCARNDTA